jgi:hypothetical protein
MKKPSLYLLFTALALFLTSYSTAQVKKYEFDKITPADFNTAGLSDTTAEAIVIADVGNTRFEYGTKGFSLVFVRKTRIHVLKPEGTSYASIVIPLYKSGNDKERVNSFKGYTFNLEKGEVVKTKSRNEDMFKENESEHWENQKIAMPAVRVNSIIEFEYTIQSDFTFNLQSWYFQSSIPVNYSEYNVLIPEYFEYKKISHGYVPLSVNEVLPTTQRFTVHIAAERTQQGYVTQIQPAHDEIFTPAATSYRWVAVNVPALIPEPFITTVNDYLSSIEFELSVVKMPESPPRNVIDTWETINTRLLEEENFGSVSRKGNFISDELPGIISGASTSLEKATVIYNHIQKRMKWNGDNAIIANNVPRKVYEDRTGSVADINLMLVAILREAGLDADPVILSTRSHGMIFENYPILSKFNYVIVLLRIGDFQYFLDPTSSYTPFNTLPERCLNGSGRIISKNNPGWVKLLRSEIKNEHTSAVFTLQDDGSYTGNTVINSLGLYGNDRRNKFKSKDLKDFIKDFNDDHGSWTVNSFHYENLDTLSGPFIENYAIEAASDAQFAGNMIYMNVMAGLGQTSNPFKLESRVYPIDFGSPIKESCMIQFKLPEGWQVEELPKSAIIELPGKSGIFKFMTAAESGMIQVTSTLMISKTMFLPEDYEHLKEFFRLIVSKHSEQIVLKKT